MHLYKILKNISDWTENKDLMNACMEIRLNNADNLECR
jgi:hypothetical protein